MPPLAMNRTMRKRPLRMSSLRRRPVGVIGGRLLGSELCRQVSAVASSEEYEGAGVSSTVRSTDFGRFSMVCASKVATYWGPELTDENLSQHNSKINGYLGYLSD